MLSLLLLLLYPLAIQYKKGGLWRWTYIIAVFAILIDVIVNYTELALLTWDFPKAHEHTFSVRLNRLQYGTPWQQFVARVVIPYLNYFDPEHVQVKHDLT